MVMSRIWKPFTLIETKLLRSAQRACYHCSEVDQCASYILKVQVQLRNAQAWQLNLA